MKVINISVVFCVPPMTAFVIFTTYEFQEARLVSTVAFTTLSLFNILRFPLVVLPKALRAVSGERCRGRSPLQTTHGSACPLSGSGRAVGPCPRC